MAWLPAGWNSGPLMERTTDALQMLNRRIEGHGLTLQPGEIRHLARRHQEILQDTGRVEFGDGILPKLVFAFCDSPYIAPKDFAATVEALLECFYHFKNETLETQSDDELLAFMKEHFDGDCHGSVEYLSGTGLEALARAAHFAGMDDDAGDMEADPAEEEDADAGDWE